MGSGIPSPWVFLYRLRKRDEAVCYSLKRAAAAERIRFIRVAAAIDSLSVHTVALVVVNGGQRGMFRLSKKSGGDQADNVMTHAEIGATQSYANLRNT